ncbi:MAG TPA: membrane dipeptidase, partial [Rhabdochlamydiaceae bacterium]|nr:membrane dipeptidase [Rhabdochlamydiaceae bacterium]
DGLELLKWLDQKEIAIDFSHASDRLCDEIINAIDKYGLQLRIMASHCNFRKILDEPRNLTDEIAKEIMRRNGIMGIVFYKKFVDPTDPTALIKHMEHGLSLGGENALCFGADFFSTEDPFHTPLQITGFFDELSDSSKYPYLIQLMQQHFTQDQIQKITSQNVLDFINSCYAAAERGCIT